MTATKSDFDDKAKTWDSDPVKTTRAQAVADRIRQSVPLSASMAALEYGCGTGLLSFALLPYLGHVTLAHSSTGMVDVLREKIAAGEVENMRPVMWDFASDPLPEERFGLIYSLMTFHHIPDTDKVLRDFHSLLDAPGHLCVADLDSEDGSFHGPDFTGHRGFDRGDLGRKAREAGFNDIQFTTVFHVAKGDGPGQKSFPVFLMVAKKT